MKKPLVILGILALCLVVFFMLGPLYIVNEGTQAVVTRFGEIVNTRTNAGLYFKVPFLDIVTVYPKRMLSLDGDGQRIPTKENQFIIVDTTTRWKIADPQKFYQSFKSIEAAYDRLGDIIDSAVRTVITQNSLSEIVRSSNKIIESQTMPAPVGPEGDAFDDDFVTTATSSEAVYKGRRQLSLEMAEQTRRTVPEYGIELIDVVPRQIKYSDEMTESVYNRMIKERNQVAQRNRSLGEGKKAEWFGKLEGDKRSILSDAYRKAEEIKGNADAEASRIYAQSYSKDPEFFSFWKSLDSYQLTMPKMDATFSTDMQYFKYLYSANGR